MLNCKSGAEYLLNQLHPFNEHFDELLALYNKYSTLKDSNELTDLENKNFLNLLKYINTYSNLITDLVVSGKITSITAAALQQGQSKDNFLSVLMSHLSLLSVNRG